MDETLVKILSKLEVIEKNQREILDELAEYRTTHNLAKHQLKQFFSDLDQRINNIEGRLHHISKDKQE